MILLGFTPDLILKVTNKNNHTSLIYFSYCHFCIYLPALAQVFFFKSKDTVVLKKKKALKCNIMWIIRNSKEKDSVVKKALGSEKGPTVQDRS